MSAWTTVFYLLVLVSCTERTAQLLFCNPFLTPLLLNGVFRSLTVNANTVLDLFGFMSFYCFLFKLQVFFLFVCF